MFDRHYQTQGKTLLRLIASTAIILVSACGKSEPQGAKSSGSADASASGGQILAQYLKEHGDKIADCFGPEPAIRNPGAIQTVPSARPVPAAINRLVVAIDASGSMAAKIGGETKMDAAKHAAGDFLDSVPRNTQVGLVAFGHRGTNLPSGKAASCAGVETIYPLGRADAATIKSSLSTVRATGWTPLAAAITVAGRSFVPSQTPGAQVVYVVSDGLETCGGDPVAAARALNAGPVKAIVNIIGFDLESADRAQLSSVAAAGGGSFVEAKTASDVSRMLDEIRRKAQAASAMTTEYFDAGARSTDNNIAVGRYTTDLNFCLARTTSAESSGLAHMLDENSINGDAREAELAALRVRHERYRDRSSKVAADLLARSTVANDAIAAQQRNSEIRLGVKP